MKLDSMQDLALDGLQDLYSAETQAVQAYPQLMEAASSPELKAAFQEHLEQTQNQVSRLEQIFQQMGQSPGGKQSQGFQGIVAEAQELIQQGQPGPVLDAALIAAAQKGEHFEIACYGTARTLAQQMGQQQAVQLLEETLQEEKQTDQKLTQLAENLINQQAAQTSA